jgi:microcystin-dependent protein
MVEPFLGEIEIYAFNFAPYQWAFCSGQTIAIQQASALFALLGTQYGGNGTTTFQLPNFVNRAGCNQGQSPGLSQRVMGETFGENGVSLSLQETPAHNHLITAYTERGSANKEGAPSTGYLLGSPTGPLAIAPSNPPPNASFNPMTIGLAGGNQPHENRQPFLALNYCIAMAGIFPSFN